MSKTLIAFFLILPAMAFSQTGSIRGQVTDARTGEPLVGANVIVIGSKPGYGAATDVSGMFLIYKLPLGEYVLKASYVDYQSVIIQNVNVSDGITTEVNFTMRAEGEPEPVVVKAGDSTVVQRDTTKANQGDTSQGNKE
jgi:hypothetical protein